MAALTQGLMDAASSSKLLLQVVLVNNGSTDRTGEVIDELASSFPAVEALHLASNLGYGGGILAGMGICRGAIRGYMWGDGQIRPEVAFECYRQMLAMDLDMCKARRIERHDGLTRLLTTRTYNAVLPLLFPVGTRDANGCPKLFTASAWERLQPQSKDWFLDPEIMIRARRLGLRIGEVDSVFHARAHGRSKVRMSTVMEFARHLLIWRLKGWP